MLKQCGADTTIKGCLFPAYIKLFFDPGRQLISYKPVRLFDIKLPSLFTEAIDIGYMHPFITADVSLGRKAFLLQGFFKVLVRHFNSRRYRHRIGPGKKEGFATYVKAQVMIQFDILGNTGQLVANGLKGFYSHG
jgi:hypothetical protein